MRSTYQHYSPTDFVCDDAFLKHQLEPTAQSAQGWEEWLQANPHKREDWQQAVRLLEAVRLGLTSYARTYLSEEAESYLLACIRATNRQAGYEEEGVTPVIPIWQKSWLRIAAAASVALALGVGLWLNRYPADAGYSYREQIAQLPPAKTEQVNLSNQIREITLPDGSQVWLKPQSRISYAPNFGQDDRSIYLSGEATFEVTRNPKKPFYVFSGKIVTKVLGTRFVVKALENADNLVVQVQHGQVSVYRHTSKDVKLPRQALDGVLLQPNQQVIFSRRNEQFTKSIVEQPALLPTTIPVENSFVFEETPVVEVLERLKAAYGIDIIYNAEVLEDCELTASLSDESLFQKLEIIAQSIGATYEIVEGQVIFTAKGCKNL